MKPIGNATLIEAVLLFGGVLGEVGGQVLFEDTKQIRMVEWVLPISVICTSPTVNFFQYTTYVWKTDAWCAGYGLWE